MRHVYVDAEWPHNVHAYETRRRFQADYYYEACQSVSLAPLEVQMLSFPAIWSGLPCAPWTVPSNCLKGPHWAR